MPKTILLTVILSFVCLCKHACYAQDIDTYIQQGMRFASIHLDSSIYYFNKCVEKAVIEKNWDSKVLCLSALSTAYWRQENINDSYAASTEALNTINKHQINFPTALGSALNNIAYYHLTKRDYNQAIDYFDRAFQQESKGGNPTELAAILINLGNCYSKKGEYNESIKKYKKAINLFNDNNIDYQSINSATIDMAKAHYQLMDHDKAVELYLQALNNLTKVKNQSIFHLAKEKQRIYFNLALIYFETNEESKFQESLANSILYSKKNYNKNLHLCYNLMGRWHSKNGKNVEAEDYFNKALQIQSEKWGNFEKHPSKGIIQYNLAQHQNKVGQTEKGLQTALQAIEQFNLPENYLADHSLLNLLEFISKLYLKQGEAKKSIQYTNLGISKLNILRRSYLDNSSKQILAQNVVPIFEKALDAYYMLYSENQTFELVDTMFQIAENSKAILLLESMNEITARGIGGIPDSLLQEEKDLKLDITYLEKKINEIPKTEKQTIQQLESKLFKQEEAFRTLIGHLEKKYPKYHQLKFKNEFANLQAVKNQLLDKHTTLIEYFIGNESIYIFQVSKDNQRVEKIDLWEGFESDVQKLLELIKNPPKLDQAQEDFENFTAITNRLYQHLIQPLDLGDDITTINIVPDDILSTIPFEVLLTNLPDQLKMSYNTKNLDYLFEDYSISYNYSASVLLQQKVRTNSKKKFAESFVGFAPSFGLAEDEQFRSCNEMRLNSLQCNKPEIENIAKLLRGKAYTDQQANITNFNSSAANSKILHFATHSCLNDNNPMDSKIFLNDSYIDNYDLYNLDLNAELVVLSACQTGSGVLRKGEGVMSLSRGFVHAGCSSVLMSLWSVEDCSTSNIMQEFYENLHKAKRKDVSLNEAKLSYISQADKLHQHPFYWAAFVQFGEADPLPLSKPRWTTYLGGFLFLLFIVFGLNKLYRKA